MAEPKDLQQAKAEFASALLQSVDGMGRVRAEQKLSSILSDLWNRLEAMARQMPVKLRDEKAL